ncbi:hypothetical protein BH24DEI2_BH24DEI2_12870 [soil metagenome]
MDWFVFTLGLIFVVLGFSMFGQAFRFRAQADKGVSKTAIYTFLGFGFIALGALLFSLGYFRLFYPETTFLHPLLNV